MENFAKVSDIMSGIETAFGGADACYCHGPAKLSYIEICNNLVEAGVIDRRYYNDIKVESSPMFRATDGNSYALKKELGIETLGQLKTLTLGEIMQLSGVGFVKAKQIELSLARDSIFLADGKPDVLRAEIASIDAEQGAAAIKAAPDDPDAVRQWAADQLWDLGQRVATDAETLKNNARRLDRDGKVGGGLNRYINERRFGYHVVAAVRDAIKPMEDAEVAVKRVAREVSRAAEKARRAKAPPALPQNVVKMVRAG
jgi:hypothetical protein